MSKKETNSFIFEGEKLQNDFFEDNEEDNNEIKRLHNILTNSPNKIEEEDDNKDLNNITSVSETDKVYLGEVKDATKKSKSQESEYEIEDELNETSLTNNNLDEEQKDLDEILDNNINNKNNNDILKNEVDLNSINQNNKNNLNIKNSILDEIKKDEFLLNNENVQKKDDNNIKKNKNKNKSKNKSLIFLIKKIKIRSKKIQLLRKKKGLHIIRKKDSDTIRKKVKTYFHNYLLDLLNSSIKKLKIKKEINSFEENHSKKPYIKKINKFLKLNNKFTTNVSKNINRNLLLKKISQILMNEPISSKYKAYDLKNNYYLTKYLLSLEIVSDIHQILNKTYMDLYNEFIKSSNFKNILKKVKNRDGEAYMNKFKNVSNNYIAYFNNNTSKKEPKCEINKSIFYKDKFKNDDKSKKKIKILNVSFNKSINNELPNSKNINEMSNISHVNNNMSLIEDFQDFIGNRSFLSIEENSLFELDHKYFNIHKEANKYLDFFNNNFHNENNYIKKNSENLINNFKKEEKMNENESKFWTEKKYEFSFDKNNLSQIEEDRLIQGKTKYMLEENSIFISKKRTSDFSNINESDYTLMKFNDNNYKSNINNKNDLKEFKE